MEQDRRETRWEEFAASVAQSFSRWPLEFRHARFPKGSQRDHVEN